MSVRNTVLILLASVILQTILPNAIGLYQDLRIQLALIVIVYFALHHDWFQSAMTGVAGGFIMDLFSGGHIGVYALTYGVIAMLIGRVQEKLLRDSFLTVATVIVCASLLSPILVFNVLALYGLKLNYAAVFAKYVLPSTAANAIVGCAVLPMLRRIKDGRSAARRRSYP
jgi:rod shape-determining protein MreD